MWSKFAAVPNSMGSSNIRSDTVCFLSPVHADFPLPELSSAFMKAGLTLGGSISAEPTLRRTSRKEEPRVTRGRHLAVPPNVLGLSLKSAESNTASCTTFVGSTRE